MSQIDLNILDKGALAWDREALPFNSHLAIELESPLDPAKIKSAFRTIVTGIPILQTVIVEDSKKVRRIPAPLDDSMISQALALFDKFDPEAEKEFRRRPFKLSTELPLRVMHMPLVDGGSRLLMTIHHSAADGLAQTILLAEFFKAYEKRALSEWTQDNNSYRISRFLFKDIGFFGTLQYFGWFLFRIVSPEKPKPVTMIDKPNESDRDVNSLEIYLDKTDLAQIKTIALNKGINAREYIIYAWAKALDQTASENGDQNHPVVLSIPLSFRLPFGHFKYLQNAAGITRIVFQRSEIRSKNFPEIFKRRMKSRYSLKEASRTIFASFLGNLLFSTSQLRKKFEKLDRDPNVIYSTSLVSIGRIPKNLELPKSFRVKKFSAYMTLFKNPGLGLTLIGTVSQQTLSIHYLSKLISSQTVNRLKTHLLSELNLNSKSSHFDL